jgi:hypothetical protein
LKKTPDADEDDDEDRRRYGGLLTLAKFWKNGPPQDGFFWEDELCDIEYHIHLPRNIWDTPAILLLMDQYYNSTVLKNQEHSCG